MSRINGLTLAACFLTLSSCAPSRSSDTADHSTNASVNADSDAGATTSPAASPAATPSPVAAFGQCAACHSLTPGKALLGPSLAGVAGRVVGSEPRFSYSASLTKAGKAGDVWTAERLDAYIANPNAVYPGNKMGIGVGNAKTRREIIDFLLSAKR